MPATAMNLVQIAQKLAQEAHAGQTRRDGHTPYISHPAAVAARLAGEAPEVIATAWLHDVLEDTAATADSLRQAGIPEEVIAAVQTLTKDGCSYETYLERVRASPVACKVKIADMLHNLSESPTQKQIIKYARGLLSLVTPPDA